MGIWLMPKGINDEDRTALLFLRLHEEVIW